MIDFFIFALLMFGLFCAFDGIKEITSKSSDKLNELEQRLINLEEKLK